MGSLRVGHNWATSLFSLSCIVEENGNPLQRSCLENPRDRGDWWAVIYGVVQSRTRLKQQSSEKKCVQAAQGFLGGASGKGNRLPIQEMGERQVWSLAWDQLLGRIPRSSSSILAWKIPWTEEPGGLQSMRPQRFGRDWAQDLQYLVLHSKGLLKELRLAFHSCFFF